MATVSVVVPGLNAPLLHDKVTIVTQDGGMSYTAPFLSAIGIDSFGSRWSLEDRPGRFPLTTWGGLKAAKGSIQIKVGTDLSRSFEDDFSFIRGFAISQEPVVVACGRFYRWTASTMWVVDDLRVDDWEQLPGTNEIAQATVTMELLAAMTAQLAVQINR